LVRGWGMRGTVYDTQYKRSSTKTSNISRGVVPLKARAPRQYDDSG